MYPECRLGNAIKRLPGRFRDFLTSPAPKPSPPHAEVTLSSRPAHPALPEHIRFGHGISGDLVEFIDADPVTRASRRPLLVLGGASRNAAWAIRIASALRRRFGAGLTVMTRLGDGLTLDEADRLIAEARQRDPDLVVGVGGGSVLDAAKVIAMLSGSVFTMRDAAANPVTVRRVLPVVAVPTTPGSGSEATPTATVWDVGARRKLALDDPRLAPRLAVVDPLLSQTLPLRALAAAALDGLAHGVESAWSTKSTADSRAHALRCVGLIAANLADCLRDRENVAALSAVSLGAAHGGVAIATTRTTLAHALSYPLTAWHHLAHGHACGLMLGPVARFNAEVTPTDCDDPRGVGFVRSAIVSVLDVMGVESAQDIGALLTELCEASGLRTLKDLGDVDATAVIKEAESYDRSGNNPRRLDLAGLVPLLDHKPRN